jgi:two-component system sensor histidine kinase TctE
MTSFKPGNQPSIRKRLLLWLLIPLVAILAAGVISDFQLASGPVQEAYDQALVGTALAISAHVRQEHGALEVELSPQAESILRAENQVDQTYISVLGADGRLVDGDGDLGNKQAEEIRQNPVFYDAMHNGQPIRVAQLRLPVGDTYATIQVGETIKKRTAIARKIAWITLGLDFTGAIATILLILVGVKKGLRPVDELSTQISMRTASDLRPLAVVGVPIELEPLALALNRLFTLLVNAASAQNRFVANAAHQLRTPLAGLQTQLELLASDPDFAAGKVKLVHLLRATERISHLVSQLLVLAKADPAEALFAQQQGVDLKDLVEHSASIFLDQAIARQIDLGFEIDSAHISGNPWLLREMLGNLIDNAIRYTPVGGIVTVRCGIQAGQTYIEVEDSGLGIPSEESEKIFDRFYRIPGSPDDGCGLGLAIVKEIADMHAAKITIQAGQSNGAIFRISWPIEKTAVEPSAE